MGEAYIVAAVRTVIPMFAAHQDTRTPVRAAMIEPSPVCQVTVSLRPRKSAGSP